MQARVCASAVQEVHPTVKTTGSCGRDVVAWLWISDHNGIHGVSHYGRPGCGMCDAIRPPSKLSCDGVCDGVTVAQGPVAVLIVRCKQPGAAWSGACLA
jgi:hypothetical protein